MDYKVTVDFAPIYECITSLNAFIGKQNHTAMDAGTPGSARFRHSSPLSCFSV